MPFRGNIVILSVIPLLIVLLSVSYIRFSVQRDYFVSYEIDCDPLQSSCFVGCEDDECTETYYYAIMQKHAAELFGECGDSIEECDAAQACESASQSCFIEECDGASDDSCESINEPS